MISRIITLYFKYKITLEFKDKITLYFKDKITFFPYHELILPVQGSLFREVRDLETRKLADKISYTCFPLSSVYL